jgi:DNA-binding transcriptional MerR regulator
MSKQTQISLDFGQEEQAPSVPPAGFDEPAADPAQQYMAAGGVGVRLKSYKRTPLPPPEDRPEPVRVVNGDLFGEAMGEEPSVAAALAPEPADEQLPVVSRAAPPQSPAAAPTEEQSPIDGRTAPRTSPAPRKKSSVKKGPSKRGRKSLKQVAAEADLIEIPQDEVLFSKQYYTMGEVSEMFRVNQSLLRFWESEFDILQPRKNKKGDRHFRPADIKNLHLIYHLLRQKKYTIEGAKDFLKTNKKAEERFEVIRRLQQIKAFLQEWKAQL